MSYQPKELVRFATIGSVDDGKSTLLGQLMYSTNNIYEDHYEAIKQTSLKMGKDQTDLSLLLDGLASEREQGITVDVAYHFFETAKRKFILIDTPGHEQYTPNMVTGITHADLAILLVDARKGLRIQSKRHAFLLSLTRCNHVVVAINKMDLVDYKQEVYDKICEDFSEFSEKLNIPDIRFIPISALAGDNIVKASENIPWYDGPSIFHILESAYLLSDHNLLDFRFPVQNVIRTGDFRGYAGKIISGSIHKEDEVTVLPSGKNTKIESIVTFDGELEEAKIGQCVTLTVTDEIDIDRGSMLVRRNNQPFVSRNLDTMLYWMSDEPMDVTKQYLIQHNNKRVTGSIAKLFYRVDMDTLHRQETETLVFNDTGRLIIQTTEELCFDSYSKNKGTGAILVIDPHTHNTVGVGMIREQAQDSTVGKDKPTSQNVFHQASIIDRSKWEDRNKHQAFVIWFTGLSGAGKSTIARGLQESLFQQGQQVMHLDGDNLRTGLCGDLDFSPEGRAENIRRAGEVAKLFFEQGNVVICSFISPYADQRNFVRSIIPEQRFVEVFVDCPLEVCKERDVKGLYEKAIRGEIPAFTGISSPYEKPEQPEVVLDTVNKSTSECIEQIVSYILQHKK